MGKVQAGQLHLVKPYMVSVQSSNTNVVNKTLNEIYVEDEEGLRELLSKQNQAGETALFVAAEYGYVDLVNKMIMYHEPKTAAIRAKNGYDALHIAAKQGDVDIVKELLNSLPEFSMTVDLSNTTALHTTALHTAAAQGHIDVVNLLLEADGSLALITRSNGKTAMHSATRNEHLEVVKALLAKEPGVLTRIDKKGKTRLHMAVKGTSLELVEVILGCELNMVNMIDTKGNTVLHVAARKGWTQFINFGRS